MKQTITRINPFDMAILLMLFEGSTLLMLGLSIWLGMPERFSSFTMDLILSALEGIIGTAIALGIWHTIKGKLRMNIGTVTHFHVFRSGIANTIFLMVLWLMFHLFSELRFGILNTAILGFVGTAAAFLVLILLYPYWPYKLKCTISQPHLIRKASITVALFAGIYEAFILPIMFFLLSILPFAAPINYTITGLIMGFVGGLLGTIIVNFIAPKMKPWVELQ